MPNTWSVVIEGSPASGNQLGIVTKYRRTKSGDRVSYPSIQKRDVVEAYQTAAARVIQTARPSGWKWDGGFLRIVFRFSLQRDADCDNLQKTISDALAGAIGVNDKYFLPTVVSKTIGVKQPFVELTIGPATALCPICGNTI